MDTTDTAIAENRGLKMSGLGSGPKKVTIKDVAKLAGVSMKTVSRVSNDEPNVRQVTRERVQQVIDEMGYQPDERARHLASLRGQRLEDRV